jgi:hypothetical protein
VEYVNIGTGGASALYENSLRLGGERRDRQFVERIADDLQMPLGQMQMDRRVPDVSVTQQHLDAAEVGAGSEQVRGIAMSPMPHAA